MITFTTGNIFQSNAQAIVNTVNCVGVMGAGLALQFKKLYPANFTAYQRACGNKQVRPGQCFVHASTSTPPEYIINFPTKRHWKDPSRMEDVQAGLKDLVGIIRSNNIQSIAIPPLGAGLGGLKWREVRALIESELGYLAERTDVRITVYEPQTSNRKR